MADDPTVIELQELLGDDPGTRDVATSESMNTRQGITELLEELEDGPLWEQRSAIVEKDLLTYMDNPSIPNATERFNMMDKLGANTSWYDKWVSDRAGQVEYGEWGRVELTTLTKEFFMPRFLERDEAIRRAPINQYPWDGVAEVRPFGALTKKIVEGVY